MGVNYSNSLYQKWHNSSVWDVAVYSALPNHGRVASPLEVHVRHEIDRWLEFWQFVPRNYSIANVAVSCGLTWSLGGVVHGW